MIKIGLLGAKGRMGSMIASLIEQRADMTVTISADRDDDPKQVFDASDVVIDFSSPGSTQRHAQMAAASRTPYVVGTTGLSHDDHTALDGAALDIPVVQAGNFSLGVNLLVALTQRVAQALDDDFDIEIMEMHHRHKVDAPSGTAKMLGEAAAYGRKQALTDVANYGREGITGERPRGEIGFSSLRGGSVIGEHSVIFASEHERLNLEHIAENRGAFATGALVAAKYATTAKPGRLTMQDILGISA